MYFGNGAGADLKIAEAYLGKKGINKRAEGRKRINKEKKLKGRKEGQKESQT